MRLNVEFLVDRSTPSTFAAFGLDAPDAGPFPSDRFTVADSNQLTNRRVNLPLPDAATRPSDYADLSVINTLDGFNLQPRLSIPFSGPARGPMPFREVRARPQDSFVTAA